MKYSCKLCHQAVETGCNALKTLLKAGARAGDVDAHEAVEAVHDSRVDPNFLIEKQTVLDVVR